VIDARTTPPAPGEDRGTVTILLCAGAFMMMLGGLAVADAGTMLMLRARAQAAADAAVLAAVAEQIPALSSGQDPRAAAERHAAGNGATVVSCECEPGTATAVVAVEIEARAVFLTGWAGRRIRAAAAAAADPGLLTYRR